MGYGVLLPNHNPWIRTCLYTSSSGEAEVVEPVGFLAIALVVRVLELELN